MTNSPSVPSATTRANAEELPLNPRRSLEVERSRIPVRQSGEALLPRNEFVFRTAEGGFVWQQPVSIAKPAIEHGYVIPKTEWDALKRNIQQLPDTRNWYELGASYSFGTFVAAAFALPVFYDIKDRLPSGVWIAGLVVCCLSALLTPLLIQFSRKLKVATADGSVSKLVSDMTSIEQRFRKPTEPEAPPD